MSALFNFNSFLTVVLLVICTCTFVKMQFPAVLEQKTGRDRTGRRFHATFGVHSGRNGTKDYMTIVPIHSDGFDLIRATTDEFDVIPHISTKSSPSHPSSDGVSHVLFTGFPRFRGFFWKAARIGERLSPWVAAGCFTMGISIIFF